MNKEVVCYCSLACQKTLSQCSKHLNSISTNTSVPVRQTETQSKGIKSTLQFPI